MRQPSAKNVRGITLIELIFAITIASVLCAISLPALGSLLQSGQSRSAHNALVAALNLARSTAASRQSDISICPSRDGATCDNAIWWQNGWIVFADTNHDGVRTDREAIIHVGQMHDGMAIASTAGRRRVTYRADGTSAGSNLTFTFCDRRGPASADTVVISNTGRIRSGKATATQAAAACAGLPAP
ncbi:MAG: GspH/FimT family pseudopilin [Xanthomonadaceae bacterium]|nr:GspH/FimT family pseudopilin [Xanthomonadaceae bacterium]